jgi:fructose 5-dehydrogenase small subunit
MKDSHEYSARAGLKANTFCRLPNGARRAFIAQSGVTLGALAVFPSLAVSQAQVSPAAQAASSAASAAISDPAFHQLAEFLTGKTLDGALTVRTLQALKKVDPPFDAKAGAVSRYIAANTFTNIDAFTQHADLPAQIKADALAIVSALYLGYAGTARTGVAHDNTQFVSYTQALMYRLTNRYTPIPSYSRWGTGYWTTVPA